MLICSKYLIKKFKMLITSYISIIPIFKILLQKFSASSIVRSISATIEQRTTSKFWSFIYRYIGKYDRWISIDIDQWTIIHSHRRTISKIERSHTVNNEDWTIIYSHTQFFFTFLSLWLKNIWYAIKKIDFACFTLLR